MGYAIDLGATRTAGRLQNILLSQDRFNETIALSSESCMESHWENVGGYFRLAIEKMDSEYK